MSVLNFLSEETFNEQMDKANQYLKYIAAGVGVGYTPKSFAEIQQQIPERYIEQPQSDYNESHYRTTAESDSQSGVQ